MNALEAKWQAALRGKFPGIIVRQNLSIPEEDTVPDLNVFMIPDERMVEFTRFLIDERFDLMNRENLADANLLDCSVSETQRCYPHIYAEAQKESRRSGVASRSKPAKTPRKPAPKKTAVRATAASRR